MSIRTRRGVSFVELFEKLANGKVRAAVVYEEISAMLEEILRDTRLDMNDSARATERTQCYIVGAGFQMLRDMVIDNAETALRTETALRNVEKLEAVQKKALAFAAETPELDKIEKEVIEQAMPLFLETMREQLEVWQESWEQELPELAPGAETGEDTPEELIKKLYRNTINIKGLFRYLCLARTKRNTVTDENTNSLTIKGDNGGEIVIQGYIDAETGKDIANVNIDEKKLLLRAFMAVAEKPRLSLKDREVSFKLKEFCNDVGAEHITRLRAQAEQALVTLAHESWKFEVYKPTHGNGVAIYNPIFSKGEILDNGTVFIRFGEDLWRDICAQKKIMAVPTEILKIKAGRHPHAFFLYLKLAEAKNHRHGTEWEGKITMEKAIENCPTLPTEAEVRKTNRDYKGRIIKPILADALSLKGETIGSVKFQLTQGKAVNPDTGKEETVFKAISYKKALELDYETLRDRLVIFADDWIDYPHRQVTQAQERRAKELEERKQEQAVKDAEKLIEAEKIMEAKKEAGKG